MKHSTHYYTGSTAMKFMKGSVILEVLIAIVIFVIGMLALAHLQTNLTRSATDANTRTIAVNVAEEVLERLRSFQRVSTDPNGVDFAFQDIKKTYVDKTVTRSGNTFTVAGVVDDYYFSADRTTATKTKPTGAVLPDFKYVELTVSWDNNSQFQVDETQQATGADMKTGEITIKEVIPSIPSLANAKVAAEDDGALGGPPVDYTPGAKPEIVAIDLKNSKFKESQTPTPDVYVSDERVETWFDVVTYSQANNTIYLRREEFLVVSCDCTLRKPSGTTKTGFLPTTWNGVEYAEGEWVSKDYGESNGGSPFCTTCCRDHHDDSNKTGADFVYDPYKDWTEADGSGAHKHFKQGSSVVADKNGDDYFEACRMIRKDGFMRVAQDFRQESLVATQESFFSDATNVGNYSNYVTTATDAFFKAGGADKGATFAAPAAGLLPGDDAATNNIPLPTAGGEDVDQLVSRAVYVDHLTADAKFLIDCMVGGKTGAECGAPGANHYLEVYPFYEVQTTWLSHWSENANKNPVAISSDPLRDNNTHSRGKASKTSTVASMVTGNSEIHRGNVGLTSTTPIDPFYYTAVALNDVDLFINANPAGGTPPPPVVTGVKYAGSLTTYASKVSAPTITGSGGVNCTQNAGQFECIISDTATSPSITISDYSIKVKGSLVALYVCESPVNNVTSRSILPNSTTIDLSAVSSDMITMTWHIQDTPCGT